MSSPSSSAAPSDCQGDYADDYTALNGVRQSLAARPLSGKSRAASSHRPLPSSVDSSAHSDGNPNDRYDDEAGDDRPHGQSPDALKQRLPQRPPFAPDAVLSHVADGALLSVSSATTTSASRAPSKPLTAKVRGLPPPRRILYYGGFLPHTLDAHDLAAAVFPKASSTNSPPLPRSMPHAEDATSAEAKHQGRARSPQKTLTPGHRERQVPTARSKAAFNETLAEAMVSTAEHMLESQKWRDSAGQQQQQQLCRCSLSTIPMIGGVIAIGNSGAADPALTAASGGSPTRGLSETPITSRAMAAFGHTAADVFAVADDDDDSEDIGGISFHRAMAMGPSRQPSTSSVAPSASWNVTGRPVSHECAMATVSSGAALPEAAARGVVPQLSHHQLTEAFYGCYKGGEMAQDACRYFVAQQQQQQHKQSCGVSGGTGNGVPRQRSSSLGAKSREGSQHQRSGSSAAKRTASMTMPAHAAARAQGSSAVQQVLGASRRRSKPVVTPETSPKAAAASHGAWMRLEPLSISTEAPLPVLRSCSDAAAADGLRRRHVRSKTRLSITDSGCTRTNSSGSHHSSGSNSNGHRSSPTLPPPKLSAAVGPAAAATNDRIQALLRQSVFIYQEAQRRQQQSRPRMDQPDA